MTFFHKSLPGNQITPGRMASRTWRLPKEKAEREDYKTGQHPLSQVPLFARHITDREKQGMELPKEVREAMEPLDITRYNRTRTEMDFELAVIDASMKQVDRNREDPTRWDGHFQIRAYSGWPVAEARGIFTEAGNTESKVLATEIVLRPGIPHPKRKYGEIAGLRIEMDTMRMDIQCANGTVLSYDPQGKPLELSAVRLPTARYSDAARNTLIRKQNAVHAVIGGPRLR